MTVGDVKYKSWAGSASAPDLYQLLVHAKTYDAERCFLVYPHDTFGVKRLGVASTGCDTWLFTVDVRALESDLPRLLAAVGVADVAQLGQ